MEEKNKQTYGINTPVKANPNVTDPKRQPTMGLGNPNINYEAINKFFENLSALPEIAQSNVTPETTNNQQLAGVASGPTMVQVETQPLPEGVPAIEPEGDYPWADAPDPKNGLNISGAQWGNIGTTALGEAGKLAAVYKGLPQTSQEATGRVLNTVASGAAIGSAVLPGVGTAIGAGAGFIGGLIGTAGKVKKAEQQAAQLADNNLLAQLQEEEQKRREQYLRNANSEQVSAYRSILARNQGYS